MNAFRHCVLAASRRRIAFRGAACRTRQRTFCSTDEIALYDFQRAHLLSNAILSIPAFNPPLVSARHAIRAARTGLRCRKRGATKERHDSVGCPGCEQCCRSEPAGEIGFEGALIVVAAQLSAGIVALAGSLEHDGFVIASEEDERGFKEAFRAVSPDLLGVACGLLGVSLQSLKGGLISAYLIPHDCGAVEKNAYIVCPHSVVQLRTMDFSICAVENLKRGTDQADLLAPSVHLVGPIVVRLIVRETAKAHGNVEEASLRDGVHIIVAAIYRLDLPT
jgi:hypothetical protein